ncbi:MAG: cation transporting ATPase C-terminal domain-containing protein [Actinomycetota bacterium]|nr:cation transporting ATPase C-terminal domain-containing protein [Actinomycetota bacterium]
MISAVALLAAVYAPGLRDLLGTTPLTLSGLGLVLAASAVPAAVVEISKATARHRFPNR